MNEFDLVVLQEDIAGGRLKIGDVGTILTVYNDGQAFEVEFVTLTGEAVASGGRHGDNLGPMLLGGLVLSTADRLVKIPVPDAWHSVLVHPEAILETRRAREALKGAYALGEFVTQSGNLALVLAGCHRARKVSLPADNCCCSPGGRLRCRAKASSWLRSGRGWRCSEGALAAGSVGSAAWAEKAPGKINDRHNTGSARR